MASDDFDHQEVDRLVEGLKKNRRPPTPAFAALAETSAPPATPATDQPALTPGQRWTTARVLMPAPRPEPRPEPKNAFAFLSNVNLPKLPRISFQAPTEMLSSARWARVFVGLGVILSAAMPFWPYGHGWSWGLVWYMSAIVLTMVTGIWGAKLTWDARLPAAHTIAVGILLWGFGLLAAETVPRITFV